MTGVGPEPLRKTPNRVEIARYAAATNDYTPIHLDSEHAKSVGLPDVIAHGLLTLGYVGQLLTDWLGGDPGPIRSTKLRFLKPIRPGDDLVVSASSVTAAGPVWHLDIVVTRGDDIVASGTAVVDRPIADS